MNALPMPVDSLSAILNSRIVAAERAGNGGNSKVYRVLCSDGVDYAVKFYFQRTKDGLDRLEVEFSALSFIWESGIRCIPRPLVADRAEQVAVYEFIPGKQALSTPPTDSDIAEAVSFASELRRLARYPGSHELPTASEACFSLDSLIESIERRLQRLLEIENRDAAYVALSRFLGNEFAPALSTLKAWVARNLGRARCGSDLSMEKRTLSPSDFGFHNAIRRPNGNLVFVDFEYFGWDDPAKMIVDFVLHPAMELAPAARRSFVQRMLQVFSHDSDLADRLGWLYPFFGLKWCMIMLNEFIPNDLSRRAFAGRVPADIAAAQLRQLDKSRAMLENVLEHYENPRCFVYAA